MPARGGSPRCPGPLWVLAVGCPGSALVRFFRRILQWRMGVSTIGAVGLTPVPARAMTGKGLGPVPRALGFQPVADLLLPAHRAAHGLLIPFTEAWPSQV